MATVIDSLIVTLGLDAKDFEKGRKNVDSSLEQTKKRTEKTGKDIAASGKQGAEFFGQMQKAALKFFGALAVARGLTQFVSNTITLGANLSRTGRNLDISADKLQKWGNAVKQNGGTLEGFLGTVSGISQQLTQHLLSGESQMSEFLYKIGVGVTDSAGKAKDELQLLLDVAEGLEKKDWARQDKFNMLVGSGLADAGLANILLLGRQGAEDLINKQVGMSDEMAKKLEEQEKRWIDIKQRIQEVGVVLLGSVLPPIEKITAEVAKLFDEDGMRAFSDGFKKVAEFAKIAAENIRKVEDTINRAAEKIGLNRPSVEGNSESDLLSMVKAGNREAARELAKKHLEGGIFGFFKRDFSESDVEERADFLLKRYKSNRPDFSKGLPPVSMSGSGQYDDLFVEMGAKYGIDPAILKATMLKENAGMNPNATNVNTNGTVDEGLMQLNNKYHASRGVTDAFDVRQNVEAAAKFWADNLKKSGGDVWEAARRYNGSGSAAERYADSWMSIYGNVRGIPDITGGGVMSGVSGAGAGRGNVNITNGQVIINTQATDARAIQSVFQNTMVQQANSGMR